MSLQDESFPEDDIFNKLNGSKHDHESQLSSIPERRRPLTPFLNSDCSEADHSYTEAANTSGKTCVSDPTGLDQADADGEDGEDDGKDVNAQLGTSRSTKAFSYQDIHSKATKRRYKHVTSKVSQYIAAIQAQDQKRRTKPNTFQRHRSMPETLTPKAMPREVHYSAEELRTAKESSSTNNNSSEGDAQTSTDRDESYERLLNEKDRMQSYNEYLQAQLHKELDEKILLRRNFEAVRIELDDHKLMLKRQNCVNYARGGQQRHSLGSLIYCPVSIEKSTQTEHISMPGQLPSLPETLPPSAKNLTFDSSGLSAGSSEVALLSVGPAPNNNNNNANRKTNANIQPLALNFSNDSVEMDSHGNVESNAGTVQAASSSNRNSHPSSNDSAIEVEVELRSPTPDASRYRRNSIIFIPTEVADQRERERERVYYFDKRSNRVIELEKVSSLSNEDPSRENVVFFRRKRSLRSRFLRIFGPCVSCQDANNSEFNQTTYSEMPLLGKSYAQNCSSH
ncbi:protein swallow [Scaptodrosophila lebanonensis]|uniref:Protein swallow n=1 Tax=Drosophila lebanonensis TaxID=7225 RepID=A0A6J2UDL8_DROLE|nr:protein swallow [Scaptodrosophila lebanonensis]